MQGAGISNSFVTQVILGAVNFGTTFGGLYVVENFGRRKSLIVGASFMFVCFMAFASVGHFAFDKDEPTNTPGAGKGMVVLACLFITGEFLPSYLRHLAPCCDFSTSHVVFISHVIHQHTYCTTTKCMM